MFNIKIRLAKASLATSLAAAIALSPVSAAPAKADTDPLGAVLGVGALALVIGGIIAAENQNHGRFTFSTTTPSRYGSHRDDRRDSRRDDRRDHRDPPRVDSRKLLPSHCDINVRRGPKAGTYYTKTCLMQSFRSWPLLPDRCETRLDTRSHGRISAYDAQCLARYGYREEHGGGQGRDIRARR